MTKNEFIAALKSKLSGLPQNELDERLEFYCEMIEDKIEDGATEEEAVSSIGSVEDVSDRVLADVPFSSIVKEKIKNSRALSAWEIVLLVLGFPIWFSLLASDTVLCCIRGMSLPIHLIKISENEACCCCCC